MTTYLYSSSKPKSLQEQELKAKLGPEFRWVNTTNENELMICRQLTAQEKVDLAAYWNTDEVYEEQVE